MEEQPKDLEVEEAAEQQRRLEAYEKKLEAEGNGDFLKPRIVVDNEIKIVQFTKYLGMKMTTFKDGENSDRPNFDVEVMVGKNKGAKYTVNLSDATARELKKSMQQPIGKDWCNTPIDVSVQKGGKGDYIRYSKHVQL